MLKSLFRWAVALATLLGPLSYAAGDDPFAGIEMFRGEYRVLIVSTPNADDTRGRAQSVALSNAESGMRERRLIRVLLMGDDVALYLEEGDRFRFRAVLGAAMEWRRRLGISQKDFATAIVGLDGEVKRIWPIPVSAKELFAVIDAMPMRQEEIRRNDTERDALRQDFEGR